MDENPFHDHQLVMEGATETEEIHLSSLIKKLVGVDSNIVEMNLSEGIFLFFVLFVLYIHYITILIFIHRTPKCK